MHVLSIVHEDDAGAGVFAAAAEQAGWDLVCWTPGKGPAPDLHEAQAVWTFGGSMHPDQDAEHPWLTEEKALLIAAMDYAYLPPGHAAPGSAVAVEIFGEWIEGEVAAEPLYDPEGARIKS